MYICIYAYIYQGIYPGHTQQRKEKSTNKSSKSTHWGREAPPGPAEGRAVWILLIFLLIFPCVAVYFLDIFLDIWLIYDRRPSTVDPIESLVPGYGTVTAPVPHLQDPGYI